MRSAPRAKPGADLSPFETFGCFFSGVRAEKSVLSAVPDAQTDSAKQSITAALADLTQRRIGTAKELQTCVDLLELAPYRDVESAVGPAQIAAELAAELGDEQLQVQVQLIHIDILGRQGNSAESGHLLFSISDWARSEGNPHVRARSHYLLSKFYRYLGDPPSSLEHALHALEYTPPEVRPELRAEHLLAVALAVEKAGNFQEAMLRYQEVVDTGLRIGHPLLSVNALNNMACLSCELEDSDDGSALVARMRAVANEYGIVLDAVHQDTEARVELKRGFPRTALRILEPTLSPRPGQPPTSPELLAECLLTAVQAHLDLGALDQAQVTLKQALEICDHRQLHGLKVQVRLKQSLLYAAAGRYREAFEEHRAFHTASEALHSADREARARILQFTLGAQEARRDSDHFRELALRDPLTGLRNRRFVDDHLADLLKRVSRANGVLSVAMLDLDHFKRVNDTFSHDVGDAVLVMFAALLDAAAPAPSVATRLGGEEFLVILPDADEDQARRWAESTMLSIRSHDWTPITGPLPVTTSIGLTTARGAGWTRERLLGEADKNLYAAKHSGRNRSVGPA